MRLFFVSLILLLFTCCDKAIQLDLPPYEPELVIEMYLEEGKPLRCFLIESLPYSDTAINKPVNEATVIFSDGTRSDTLSNQITQDAVTSRYYNYYHPRLLKFDSTKTYTLIITGNNKTVTSTTRFSQRKISVDSLKVKESEIEKDTFSVGMVITDPVDTENFYRILVGRSIYHFATDPTDFRVSDESFNGKTFSFFSEPDYARNDTITVRVYSLLKEHYEYLESIGDARRSNFNPFSQPSRIKSNIKGGLGIFTTLRYTEKQIIIK
jgi:hypothetical protein